MDRYTSGPPVRPNARGQRATRRVVRRRWGADLSRLSCTYSQGITMLTEEMPLSDEDKAWVMDRGICEWLGWA